MICVTAVLLLPALVAAVEKPSPMLLHSAYTPFTKEDTLDVSGIPRLAKQAKAFGVNTVFVGGSMAEFDTMSIDERKTLMDAWLAAARDNELYTIVNVGTTVIADAKDLARHAARNGADAFATVPPYYNRAATVDILVEWLADLASAAPELPFWFYHLPDVTHVDFSMADLLPVSVCGLTSLACCFCARRRAVVVSSLGCLAHRVVSLVNNA